MLQRLFGLIILATLGWFLGRLLDSARRRTSADPGGPPRRPRESAPESEGTMVRDRVCNKFLPRSRALVLTDGGGEHFFCSEDCRRQFLADGSGAPASTT